MELRISMFIFLLLTLTSTAIAENHVEKTATVAADPRAEEPAAITATETTTAADSATVTDPLSQVNSLDLINSIRMELESGSKTAQITRQQVQSLDATLNELEKRLIQAFDNVESTRKEITGNGKILQGLEESLLRLRRDIRANGANVDSQKSLIEGNSIRLYELLIRISKTDDELSELLSVERGEKASLEKVITSAVNTDLNRMWMLLSIVIVFFAPLAFVMSASARITSIDAKVSAEPQQGVIFVCISVFLGFFFIGFGLMYGESFSGWMGNPLSLYDPELSDPEKAKPKYLYSSFLLYKAGFVMVGALVVYMAIGQQISRFKHALVALYVGALLIPVFGHWVAASHFVSENQGWLEVTGFTDQVGAISQNTVAGWFALVLVWRLGQRVRQPETLHQTQSDLPIYTASTILLLWLAWLGFTTGTLHITSKEIPYVMVNVGLAASAGGLFAFLQYSLLSSGKNAAACGLAGVVSGLVAIAACAQSVTYIEAVVVGALAGVIQNLAYATLRKTMLKLKWQSDAAYLVAIHGAAGTWGALCYALFGTTGSFTSPNFIQLTLQVQGATVALVYSVIMANTVFWLFRLKHQK